MLSKTTPWCELMSSMLGPWWNLLQKNVLLIQTERHSIPPHTQFSCQTSLSSLFWLYIWLIFPLPLRVFLIPSPTPDSLSNLYSALPFFPWSSISVHSVLGPPPTFSYLFFLHFMNIRCLFFFSASHIFLSPHVISSPPVVSLKLRRVRSSPRNLFCNVRQEASQSSSHGAHSTLQQSRKQEKPQGVFFNSLAL